MTLATVFCVSTLPRRDYTVGVVTAPALWSWRATSVVATAIVIGACRTPPDPAAVADAEIYVRALCEDRSARCESCGEIPENWRTACDLESCIETGLERAAELECFAQEDEFDRCRFERLSCEDYLSQNIDTSPGSTCYSEIQAAVDCAANAEQP